MPLKVFDYKCHNCGQIHEYFVADNIDPHCRFCKSYKMEKLLSSPALLKTNFADKNKHRKG